MKNNNRMYYGLRLYILFLIPFHNVYGQLSQEQENSFAPAERISVEIKQTGDIKLKEDYFLEIAKACMYTAGFDLTEGLPVEHGISLRIESEIMPVESNGTMPNVYLGARMKGHLYFKQGQEGEFKKSFKSAHMLDQDVHSPFQKVYMNKSSIPYYKLFTGEYTYLDAFLHGMHAIAGDEFLSRCMFVDTMDYFTSFKIFSPYKLKNEMKTFAAIALRESQNRAASVPILIEEAYKFKENSRPGLLYDQTAYYYEVFRTLGEIADTSAFTPLFSLLEYSCENTQKKAIPLLRAALINMGDPVLKKLKEKYKHSSDSLRFELLVTLVCMEDESSISQLLPYLNSTDSYEKETAIETLVASNDTTVIRPLIHLHEQAGNSTTVRALGTLYQKSDSLGLDPGIQRKIMNSLTGTLDDQNRWASEETIHVLEELSDAAAAEPLLDFLAESTNKHLNGEAVKALHTIMKQTGIPGSDQVLRSRMAKILSESLSDEDRSLTTDALSILRELRDDHAVKALIDFLEILNNNQEPVYTNQGSRVRALKHDTLKTLYVLTGKKYGDNLDKWNKWWQRSLR